ncbi:hypothetical protein JOF53_004637 [Crossiella equi]|uniref:Excreted virulence factor EspC (Type VII ESX diderm) n=1 Tax=Crossiella equi TaxID=130796 RepID=A0ABS5AJ95_9PSEU|nr:hypothetical protein [Crossiella equi]MBP2475765.1 hypothetical protein [Crossiella equi]
MGMVRFNREALEGCRTTVASQAGQFGAVGDRFPKTAVNAAAFGKLADSAAMAQAVGVLDAAMNDEFNAAETLLGKVDRALDAVQRTVEDTERANADGVRR